jgi:prepilin-type N-terminal cleavage/methylation domain-containing protein
MHRHTSRRVRAGFTMIELLTVVGIIVVLIAILLPVVASVQRKAREADTSAEINRLATAAQNYYNDYRAYPGPVADSLIVGFNSKPTPNPNITGVSVVTGSENLLLGLAGGLYATAGAPGKPPVITYDPTLVGKGPQSLNPLTPKQSVLYTDFNPNELPPKDPVSGAYSDYKTMAPASIQPTMADSVIPEFFDHFATPKPIIYVRARVGQTQIVDSANAQYYSGEMFPYWVVLGTGGAPSTFPTYEPGINKKGAGTDYSSSVNQILYNGPNDLFKHPTINDTVTPRNKDTFILISAGADGIWGTKDDIIYSN